MEHLLNELLDQLNDAYAVNTLRAYRVDMLEFIEYCKNVDQVATPASGELVAQYILILKEERKLKTKTILRKVSSISAVHRLLKHANPTKEAEVQIAVRKIRRGLGVQTDQEGAGYWIELNQETTRAIKAWFDVARIKDGFLLRSVVGKNEVGDQLYEGQLGRIFKTIARRAGVSEEIVRDISGHSMRVGRRRI